jgi:hypothetical protein
MPTPALHFIRGGLSLRYYGIGGWNNTNILRTATGAGLPGTLNTPFWREAVIYISSQAVASGNRRFCNHFDGTLGWWFLITGSNNGSMTFQLRSSAPTTISSASYTSLAANRLYHCYGFWNGSNVKLSVNGVTTGPGSASATYGQPSGTSRTQWGFLAGTNACDGITVLGLRGGDATKTDADATSAYNAWVAARALSASGAARCWDIATSQVGVVPSPVPELVAGTEPLSFSAGAPDTHTLDVLTNPVYG